MDKVRQGGSPGRPGQVETAVRAGGPDECQRVLRTGGGPRSLNGALRDEGVAVLREHGHEVVESDLYAIRKPQ